MGLDDRIIFIKVGGESDEEHAAKLDGPDPRHSPGVCFDCRVIAAKREAAAK